MSPGPPPPAAGWSAPGSPALAPPPPQGARRVLRILGRAVVVVLVFALFADAFGWYAWGQANRSSAEEWRDRTERTETDLRRSLTELETADAELADARERLRALAAEKAGETDENRVLSDVVAQAPEVTEAMRSCQTSTTALLNDLLADLGNPQPDVAALEVRIDEVNEICTAALDAAAGLEAAIDELGI